MDVLRWPLLLCLLVSFGLLAFALTGTGCAPAATDDEMTPATATTAAIPQPPEGDVDDMQNDSPLQTSTPSPVEIPFLKVS